MLKALKRYKKVSRKDRYLRQLVEVYASPWGKRRGTFRDFERDAGLRSFAEVQACFDHDCRRITEALLSGGEQTRPILGLILLENPQASEAAIGKQAEVLDAEAGPVLPEDRWVFAILDQLIDRNRSVYQYDYDFIDEIVPIVRSRYIGEDGRYDPRMSERFLKALWLLTGESAETYDCAALPRKLRKLVGPGHPYQPTRFTREEYLKDLIPDAMAEEFIALKCEDNPRRYQEICAEIFRQVNARATDHYEERDISLVYGYENNHHLILRTIIGLMSEGKLTPQDRVLVLGPRYIDEIRFFREILGLPKTVGLDLRSEGDYLVEGDMHDMPFPDNSFKLVFGASVVEYAYDLRKVVREIARVTKRPGYVSIIHRTNRTQGPTPIGRMDIGNVETATSVFYEYPHRILAKDEGLTANPDKIGNFPAYVLELQGE